MSTWGGWGAGDGADLYDESWELPSLVGLRHKMRKRCQEHSLAVAQDAVDGLHRTVEAYVTNIIAACLQVAKLRRGHDKPIVRTWCLAPLLARALAEVDRRCSSGAFVGCLLLSPLCTVLLRGEEWTWRWWTYLFAVPACIACCCWSCRCCVRPVLPLHVPLAHP